MWKETQGTCKERQNDVLLANIQLPWGFRTARRTSLSSIQNGSQLTERDFNVRQTACESLLEGVPLDALVFFSDEAYFHISGCVNKQNMRYWSGDNSRELHEKPLHCERATVFVVLCGHLKSRPPRRTLVPPSINARQSLTQGETKLRDVLFPMKPTFLPLPQGVWRQIQIRK